MFLHPAMKICVHCAVCSGTKDEEKWKTSGCDQCVDNSSGIQDPVELNLKADENEANLSTEGLIAIVAAAGIVIVIIAVVVPLTVFIRCKMKRRQRTGSSQVVTSLVTTGSNPRQTQCITSMTAFANRKQSPPMCTEVTTRINTECLPTQRACAVTIPEEQTANHEESRTSHTPIQEDGLGDTGR
ncbi:uncharacterized protein [Ptychodera flava]|uniref:uncharacterized protein n=1 Tax=Ptychodera flava TaxID=63121 RepID=UPI00396A8CD7